MPEACAQAIAAREVTPAPPAAEVAAYDAYHRIYRQLYAQLKVLFDETARIVQEEQA